MKIGISGPILVDEFKEYLDLSSPSTATCPKGKGGTAVNLLARGLLECGHSLVIFSLDPELTEEVVLTGPRLRICMGPFRPRARKRALDLFRMERRYIRQSIERERPDIVHAHWTYEYALGALASGVPTLITVRDWAPAILWYNRGNYRTFAYRAARLVMDWITFKRARHLSANSQYIREKILKRWKRDVPVIPNPIGDVFLRTEEKSFPSGTPIIISINNGMGRLKNVKSLIKAFWQIRKEVPGCRLRLIGDDFAPDGKAEKWAKENGLNEGIIYTGALNRDEVITALDKANLMIHPSLEESFGCVLIEAMARRVPVVGGKDSGAVPWILNYGQAGMLCDVRNPDAIAASAVKMLREQNTWEQFSVSGYQRVINSFRTSVVARLCEDEYTKILAQESHNVG